MKKGCLFLLLFCVLFNSAYAQIDFDLPSVKFVDFEPENREWFARFGQFQINFEYDINPENGLVVVGDPDAHLRKIDACLKRAKERDVNVLIFPEVSMSLPGDLHKRLLEKFERYSKENGAIIIAGTFYDENRYCKNVTIMPNGTFYSYKIRPSIFESSPVAGEGMLPADTLHVFRTKYGNLLTLVCVDLISDDANYVARNLSNRGLIDMLININFNPKSQEFMREASAMTVRHPLFVSLTNVTLFQPGSTIDGDEYGNTSIFGSVNNAEFREKLLPSFPDFYKVDDNTELQPAYKYMLGLIGPEVEGLLLYDLNLRVIRTADENNAPDQGYPTIKNIEVIGIE